MNTQQKYLAKYIFGNVQGLKYNLKNLILACNTNEYKIVNTSLNGFKFIEILDSNKITYSINKDGFWIDYTATRIEFWELTKQLKNYYIIVKL